MRTEAGLLAGTLLALARVGTGFSSYVTWVESRRIEALWQWRVTSANVMVTLAVLAAFRLLPCGDGP